MFIDYSNVPDADKLLAYDLVVLDPAAKADLRPGQRLGNKYLAYLSLVEVRKDAWYLHELKQREIPLAGKARLILQCINMSQDVVVGIIR